MTFAKRQDTENMEEIAQVMTYKIPIASSEVRPRSDIPCKGLKVRKSEGGGVQYQIVFLPF